MISQTAEYALRAIVFLGNQANEPCTTAHLAYEIDAPPSYLAKVMKVLTRAGIVGSQRGLHGGFTLARDPRHVTILEVVNAVDEFRRISKCPLGRPAHTSGLCPLHRRMDNVMAVAENTLAHTSIGEVLDEPGLLCHLPCVSEPPLEVRCDIGSSPAESKPRSATDGSLDNGLSFPT
ncbi:MAG: Rrf2 family transcriptional regulator [Pirellulaceae bacterium]|nr:transcriptional regulator [Planctomycetaceae bacterium]MDP6467287.1 Rrf2 family transcriptional regulator [Pirellulaceae bacterium]MDP6554578.1 Rrf2 family transcriptional regulator [Pirellulaceae bacterium]